jgi:hypothetical protein
MSKLTAKIRFFTVVSPVISKEGGYGLQLLPQMTCEVTAPLPLQKPFS